MGEAGRRRRDAAVLDARQPVRRRAASRCRPGCFAGDDGRRTMCRARRRGGPDRELAGGGDGRVRPVEGERAPAPRIAVRAGESVRAGEPVGTADATPAHAGLHLGIRLASDPFGYVDPLRFLPHDHAPPLDPAPPPRGDRRRRVAPPPPAAPASRPVAEPTSPLPAWPAWAGAAVLLTGAASGTTLRRRQARTRHRRAAASQLRSRGAG